MKLKSVRLHPFGRFHDELRSFDSSLVVIHGPNELGKTTIRQAIVHSLFTPTNQAAAQFRNTMERWLPLPAGDHAVVTLTFEHEGVEWTLDKRWGAGASSRLTDGTVVLGDAAAVQKRLGDMLTHNEATFRHILFTGQAELEQTLAVIDANASSLRDIRDLIRAGAGAAGDVDEQRLRKRLDERIEKAFGRWNDDRGRPEPQNGQEKGIANPWKRGTGTILEAWYAWQVLLAERDAVLELERSIDRINTLVADQERIVSEAAAFLAQYGHLRKDVAERNVLDERLARLEGETKTLGDVFRAWPVAEAALQQWPVRKQELETTRDTLLEELKNAEQRRDGAAIREAFKTIEAAKHAYDQAMAVTNTLPDPGQERVDAVDALCDAITTAENKLAARKLAWQIEADAPRQVLLEQGMAPAETLTIGADGTAGTAEARVRVVAGGITLTVSGGGDDVDALFRSLAANRARLTDELRACNATTRDALVVMVEKHRDAEALARQKEAAFIGALGNKTFAQWEQAIHTLDGLPHTRDVAIITNQIESIRTLLVTEQAQAKNHHTLLEAWTTAFATQEALQDKLLEVNAALKDGKKRRAALATLPAGFDSPQQLLERLDDAQREQLKAQEQLTDVRARCAELTTRLGDRRSQDLAEAADTAARKFERTRAEGQSYRRIRQELDRITANPEIDPLQTFGDKVAAVFSRITGGGATLEFTGQLPSRVIRGTLSLPPERLSHGGGGALALAVRLAMAEAYLAQGGGFLIFDDPLVHFDARRMAIATDILRELSGNVQVIVFTCHDHHAAELRT